MSSSVPSAPDSPRPIHLDYHATTPIDLRVAELMLHSLTIAFGNASSIDHAYGDEADQALSKARQQVAELINAFPQEIIFTSGATESLNLAIQGSIRVDQTSHLTPTLTVRAGALILHFR